MLNLNLTTVSVCVGYLDLLKQAYSTNKQYLNKNYFIITSTTDNETKQFCQTNNIQYFETDAFYKNKSSFNKGAALNSFFNYTKTKNIFENLEWILLLDADIKLNHVLKQFDDGLTHNTLNKMCYSVSPVNKENCKDYIYSCHRRTFSTYENLLNNKAKFTERSIPFWGYFQLFHINKIKKDLLNNYSIFMEHPDASTYDGDFVNRYWTMEERKPLKLLVDHFGPTGQNWKGRISDRWI